MNVTELKETLDALGEKYKYCEVAVSQGNLLFAFKPKHIYISKYGQVIIDIDQGMNKKLNTE